MSTTIDEAVLEARLTELEGARAWSSRVVSRLEMTLRTAPDYDLFRVSPIRYAAEQRIDEQEAIELFLRATRAGLFELSWHLVCAFCGHVVDSLGELSGVHSHYRCNFCRAENELALDDYLHVTFTVVPSVRRIVFHTPEQLEIHDYYLRYHFAKGVTFANGVPLEKVGESVTRYMKWLEPGERIELHTEIPPGMLAFKDLKNRAQLGMFLGESSSGQEAVPIDIADGKFRPQAHVAQPRSVTQRFARFEYETTVDLASGALTVEVTNKTTERCPLWVIFLPAAFESNRVTFDPFLSGKRLLTTQTFQELFRAQTFSADEGIAVKDITFLFSDLKGSTDMYDRIGDLNAFHLVRQHFDTVTASIGSHRGAIVKTIGDAVMATFASPTDAFAAALSMLRDMRSFNAKVSTPLHLKIGVHRGASIAVKLNDRVDYFGQTVNMAARIQGLADASEICVSKSTLDDPGIVPLLAGCTVATEQATLRGVRGTVPVCRIAAPPDA